MSTKSRLKWLCRRGTLELDILLSRYLEQGYDNGDELEKQDFERLLALQDSVLQRYFIDQNDPDDTSLNNIVNIIRSIPADRS